jgi:hypothetical protein
VLIDSRHKKWFVGTAFYLYGYLATPGGLTGGSVVGLWYGIAASALMVYAALLSLLRRVPSWWWIGSRRVWLRGHIWLGLLSGLLIVFHSGFRWGGPLERVLWAVLILTLATGVLGLLLQQFLPRILTTRIASEAPYEQIPHLCDVMRHKADALVAEAGADPKLDPGVKAELRKFFDDQVRPFLTVAYARSAPLAHPLRAEAMFGRVRAVPGHVRRQGPAGRAGDVLRRAAAAGRAGAAAPLAARLAAGPHPAVGGPARPRPRPRGPVALLLAPNDMDGCSC